MGNLEEIGVFLKETSANLKGISAILKETSAILLEEEELPQGVWLLKNLPPTPPPPMAVPTPSRMVKNTINGATGYTQPASN